MFSGLRSVWTSPSRCMSGSRERRVSDHEQLSAVSKERKGRTSNTRQELSSEILDVRHREWHKVVLLEEVKDGRPKQLEDEADVVLVVEDLRQVDTFAEDRPKEHWSKPFLAIDECSEGATHFSLYGSPRFSSFNTLISILLASRYFWTARMILTANLRSGLRRSAHSTTLPNVPSPSFRTIRSVRGEERLQGSQK